MVGIKEGLTMRHYKIYIPIILSAILLAPNISNASNYSTPNVFGKKVQKSTTSSEVNVNIPVIVNMENKAEQAKINKTIKETLLNKKNVIEQDAVQFKKEAKQQGYSDVKFEYLVDFNKKYRNDRLLSFLMSEYQYTGGAHGLETRTGVTVDSESGLLESLGIFFNNPDEAIKLIKTEIYLAIDDNKQKYGYFPDAKEVVSKTDEFQFYLNDKGFVIYFPLYELVPYANGIPEYLIEYSKLDPYLKDNYKTALLKK
jgi:hypothetical protein